MRAPGSSGAIRPSPHLSVCLDRLPVQFPDKIGVAFIMIAHLAGTPILRTNPGAISDGSAIIMSLEIKSLLTT